MATVQIMHIMAFAEVVTLSYKQLLYVTDVYACSLKKQLTFQSETLSMLQASSEGCFEWFGETKQMTNNKPSIYRELLWL